MPQSPAKLRRYRDRPSTRLSSIVKCLICKQLQSSLDALVEHCQIKHTKKQMIQGIVDITDKSTQQGVFDNQNIVEDETSNSNSSSPPVKMVKRKSPIGHSYYFRTPSSATTILKQRNSLVINSSSSSSPSNSTTSNSNSPSPYFTPEQSVKRPRRRKQLLNSLLSDVEDESSKSPIVKLIPLPPCSDIKEGIKKLKDQVKDGQSISKLDSDTDSCSDMAMPSVYCSFCSNGYKSIKLLEEHILECPKKELLFEKEKSESIESMHEIVKIKKVFLCYFCGLEFDLKLTLEKHLNEHLGEKIMTDIIQLENDFNLRPENNFIHQYYSYFVAGYNFGITGKSASTSADLRYKFYEHLLKDNKYESHNSERN